MKADGADPLAGPARHPSEREAIDLDRAPAFVCQGTVVIRTLAMTPYSPCLRAMQAFTAARTRDTLDEIWLTEHPPVYTLGLAGRGEHLLRASAIPVIKVDRGGQITYHGPGQLVAYLLFDLRRARVGVRTLVRRIENAVIEWLGSHRVSAYGKESAPGVYVRDGQACEAKIAALGLKVSNACTYHGLSVNIAMDLAPFADIDPCGYPGLQVTQFAAHAFAMSVAQAGEELGPVLARHLAQAAPAQSPSTSAALA